MAPHNKGIIAWFIANPVAANLLMAFLLVGGYLSFDHIPKELMPRKESKAITITMSYPNASPSEVQEGVVLKIEEAILDVDGIKHIQSVSSLGSGTVRITVYENYSTDEVLDDVRTAVNSVSTFPESAEKPRIQRGRSNQLALQVQLHGDISERQAKQLAHEIKRELLADERIKKVAIWGDRPYEIAIEIAGEQLQKYKLSMQQVVNRIRAESLSTPSGGIRSPNGNVLLRVDGQSYTGEDFENIVLVTNDDGVVVRVGDIGTVTDDFVEWGAYAYFNGDYGLGLAISATEDQDVLEVADAVRAYVEKKQHALPPGVSMTPWADVTYYLSGRLETMFKNLVMGGILVFVILALFMPVKIAFWVMMGLPVCFFGTFLLMPWFGVSFNMVSLFGFILILGILVDDAIVVAESIDNHIREGGYGQHNVTAGTKAVATPAIFGVLTTIIAFTPMLLAQGPQQSWLFSIGFIVCACLMFSLIESKWILPAHLAATSSSSSSGIAGFQQRLQNKVNVRLQGWVSRYYAPLLEWSVRSRYLVLSLFVAILLLSFGLMKSGLVAYDPFPSEASDFLQVRLNMAEGTSEEQTEEVMLRIRDALHELEREYQQEYSTDKGLVLNLFRYGAGGLNGFFFVELVKDEEREIDSFEIVERWRNRVGEVQGANLLDFTASEFAGTRNLSFMLVGNNEEALEAASQELLEELRTFKGLSNFNSTIESLRQEYILSLKPQAIAMGLTLADIANQTKQAFYGAEAQRIQRDHQEIKVMVRYPENERTSILDLEHMFIRLHSGQFVPLRELANIEFVMSPTHITRVNGETAMYISAKADSAIESPGSIRNTIMKKFMPGLLKKYPSVNYRQEGINQEQKDMEAELKNYFLIAMLGVFILLAIPLKSYLQPLIIMSAIPFGIVGAILGHGLLGFAVSMMSLFGIVALTGVVVNDSLLMVDFVNRSVRDGMDKMSAILQAGQIRFRAIILTTITTFFGVLPMILEQSLQAKNMIPMAISLGFGVLFATAITLLLIPCLYMMLDDIKRGMDYLRNS
ncbi:MAG TPA: efflux RND transporter permease subunit [Pseudomonadales bacterium]